MLNKVNRFMMAILCSVSCDDKGGSSNPVIKLDLPSCVKENVRNRAKVLVEDQSAMEARNVYYHPWKTCIAPYFKNFIPSQHIKVDHVIVSKFVDCHHAHIEREFG